MHTAFGRLSLVMIAVLGLAGAARGQALEAVQVTLWPEYDQPGVLVMYEATLAPTTQLPAEVRLSIPAAVGAPHAVAYRDSFSGRLMLAHYTAEVDGEWQHLDIAAPSTTVRVEYYAPLATDETERAFSLTWPGTTAVGELSYDVQQPAGSNHVSITPEPLTTVVEETLTHHRGTLGAMAMGQNATLLLAYQKTDPRLTLEIQQPPRVETTPPTVAPPPPTAAAPSVPESGVDATSWASFAIALLLLGVLLGLVWSWKKKE